VKSKLIKTVHALKAIPRQKKAADIEFKVIVFPRERKGLKSTSRSSNQAESGGERFIDSQTGMLPGIPRSAMCVQRFDDSLNSAIHITYRNSLRSSSLREPRDPLSKVVFHFTKKWMIQTKKLILGLTPSIPAFVP
jgi:hypothetical protein